MHLTRRDLLAASLAATFWATVTEAQQSRKFTILDPTTASDIEAIASQILPSDDTPGAREAGVIYFIDQALATFEADKLPAYKKGIADFQQAREKLFPHSTTIASLTSDQQITLLRSLEKTDFFDLLRTHTMLGFLANPSYGGNRDLIGWTHIGFEHRMVWTPPFGYYDAEAAK